MPEETSFHSASSSALEEAIQNIHPDLKLHQKPGISFNLIPDDLLAYIWSVLKEKSPIPPKASINQWSKLLFLLELHWILPLFYWKIGSLPLELRPPESVISQLRMAYLESRARSLNLERQLGEILDAFQEECIRALVLRGPALGWSVYPDPALRPCGDLDLLVLPEQVVKARASLERLDYKCLSKRFEATREFFREEEFVHHRNTRNNLLVDLHWVNWELHPFFASLPDGGAKDLFDRCCKVRSSSLVFETLNPVDALIQAAVHLAMIHSQEIRLIWIYDIALLARQLHVPDDWKVLQERSVTWRARLALENSLKMAQVLAGLELPERFKDFLSWPRPAADELVIFSHSTRQNWVTFLLKRYFSRPSGFLAMVRSLYRLLFPPPDIVRLTYPPSRDWLLPLSYIRRWHRWFVELFLNRIAPPRKQE